MPDPRFFEPLGPVPLGELARLAGATLADAGAGDRSIRAVAPLGSAASDEVAFFADKRYAAALDSTGAGACFVAEGLAHRLPGGCAALLTSEPQAAWARAAGRLHRLRDFDPEAPAVDPTAKLEADVRLAAGVVVGADAEIGAGTTVAPGAVIGPGVAIGRHCRIGPRAVILCSLLGDRVSVLAGAVIGEAGFGVAAGRSGPVDAPQLGRVILQDGVTVGANTCIDRGAFDDTVVGENTKIDNLVQVAHNVRLGRNCILAAHTGISGSVTVGDGVMFGGRAGVGDHVDIGAGARIGAAAGVMKSVPAGETWGGSPARPVKQWLRETAWLIRAAGSPRGGRSEDEA